MMKRNGGYGVRVMEVITGGEPGGAQRHVVELIQYLVEAGHTVTLVHGGGRWVESQLKGVSTVRYLPDLVRDIRPQADRRALAALVDMMRTEGPDVVHCHSSKAGILARYAAHRVGVPAVYTAHGYVFQDPTQSNSFRLLFRTLERWAARRSAAIITMTADDERFARQYGPVDHVYRIVNGVKATEPPLPGAAGNRVGFLGRFSREKGLHDLLAVIAAHPEWRLELAGDGLFRPLVEQYQAQHANIHWRGWVDELANFFESIDVLVQPSAKEGAPYSVLDALAAGVPVVGTRVGAMTEMLDAVDPHLAVEPGDREALAAAIQYALLNRAALAERAYAVASNQYALSNQLERTLSVLKEVSRS